MYNYVNQYKWRLIGIGILVFCFIIVYEFSLSISRSELTRIGGNLQWNIGVPLRAITISVSSSTPFVYYFHWLPFILDLIFFAGLGYLVYLGLKYFDDIVSALPKAHEPIGFLWMGLALLGLLSRIGLLWEFTPLGLVSGILIVCSPLIIFSSYHQRFGRFLVRYITPIIVFLGVYWSEYESKKSCWSFCFSFDKEINILGYFLLVNAFVLVSILIFNSEPRATVIKHIGFAFIFSATTMVVINNYHLLLGLL